jgi:sulfoxide reductase heme-binding subunit YedZ
MSWKTSAYLGGWMVVAVVIARIFQDSTTGTATWDASRASGFACYLLLWASTLTGIALHLRVRPGSRTMAPMLEIHRITSTLALAFVVVHVIGLVLDPVVRFSVLDGLVPFTSSYRPLQVGAGTLAQWLLVVVLASTAWAGAMPWVAWRKLHYLSFPCYLLALLHGVTSGTDTSTTFAVAIYAGTAALVAGALVLRMAGRNWSAVPEAA